MIREIVLIDEDLCDGCGLCIPACHEGALRIVDGKARLVEDRLCDGLGACLGHCPRGAIRIERRESEAFDEQEVLRRAAERAPRPAPALTANHPTPAMSANRPVPGPAADRSAPRAPQTAAHAHHALEGGCPGSRFREFAAATQRDNGSPGAPPAGGDTPSALRHWPVQLRLLPPTAPVLRGTRLLVAADCVPVAYADFQTRLLRDRAVVLACPKFDGLERDVPRLTEMIRANDLREIVVARMEVPCCAGILHAVLQARQAAGSDVVVHDVVLGVDGCPRAWRTLPADAAGG